jgi:hypothetical protein
VLECTWSDLEAEIVLRNLNLPVEEQERLHSYYLKLREEYRKAVQEPAQSNTASATGQ